MPAVELVWNKGIAAACDWRVPDEFPHGEPYSPHPTLAGALWSKRLPDSLIADPSAFAAVREGDLIWVRLAWLRSFVRQALPIIQSRFTLVTADSDSSVPAELGDEAHAILSSPKVLHWFTQNHDGSAPDRISPIPIGIDFHTLAQAPLWGESVSTPVQQERVLRSVRDGVPPLRERIPRVYMDFGWKPGFGFFHYRRFHPLAGARSSKLRPRVAWDLRRHPLVERQPRPLPRTEMWRRRGAYAFVLSTPGMGLDCHRTWEALALGHIVLVPPSSLDTMYESLPVRILRSWADINQENLRAWQTAYSAGPFEKLTTKYWIDEIRSRERYNRPVAGT